MSLIGSSSLKRGVPDAKFHVKTNHVKIFCFAIVTGSVKRNTVSNEEFL